MKKMYSIITISFFLLVLPSSVLAASAAKEVGEGNRLYEQDKYDEAAEKYSQAKEESPDSEIIHFNLGAALYKKGQYKEAVEATTKALSTEDRELEAKAVYNLANSTYKLGSQLAVSDMNSAIGMYREALDYYKRAIELDGSDKEAKYNHELVERKLKVLLDQLKNQQQQQDHDQNREDGQDRQQSQADSDGQKEDEQQKNQQQKKQQRTDNEDAESGDEKDQAASKEDSQETQPSRSREDASEGMSPEEAQMLLEAYGQEEAREDVRQQKKAQFRGVLKDW